MPCGIDLIHPRYQEKLYENRELKKQLETLKAMDKNQLKVLYDELIFKRTAALTKHKIGLGLVDIALESNNHFNYEFIDVDDDIAFYPLYELLQEKGIEPEIIEYMETPPDVDTLRKLVDMLGVSTREIMRRHEQVFKEAGLDDPTFTDEELLEAISQCPSLLERPIVVNGDKAALGRPPEAVLDIL